MKNSVNETINSKGSTRIMAEQYYKKIMRLIEYYVLLCFVLISFVPLLEYSWVQGAVMFIFFTGFPLLILLFIISFIKEPLINFMANRLDN